MIQYRSFSNLDPPALAGLWRACAVGRGMTPAVSTAILETLVFSKPFFDREGLIVAVDGEERVGFAHAGFGPNEERTALDTDLGVTAMFVVHPERRHERIGQRLLELSEQYLRRRGAKVLYLGGINPLNPFYLGLYGGSELPGLLASSVEARALAEASHYKPIDQCLVLQRRLDGFRPLVDRRQLAARRGFTLHETIDPPPSDWWEACTYGSFDRFLFEVRPLMGGPPLGKALFWTSELLSAGRGARTAGLIELEIDTDRRREGLCTFLVGESLKRMGERGYGLVEAQTMAHNTAAVGMYQKLGFRQIDQGTVYRKESTGGGEEEAMGRWGDGAMGRGGDAGEA